MIWIFQQYTKSQRIGIFEQLKLKWLSVTYNTYSRTEQKSNPLGSSPLECFWPSQIRMFFLIPAKGQGNTTSNLHDWSGDKTAALMGTHRETAPVNLKSRLLHLTCFKPNLSFQEGCLSEYCLYSKGFTSIQQMTF